MIQLNPRYEVIFDPKNIDPDCDRLAQLMYVEADCIKETLDAELYKQGVTMFLQLLKSMCEHFIKDEHWCYFDDMYSSVYTMLWIYDAIMKYDIDAEAATLLKAEYDEIQKTECYDKYCCPSYIK